MRKDMPYTSHFEWEKADGVEPVQIEYKHDFEDAGSFYESDKTLLEKSGLIVLRWSWQDFIMRILDNAYEQEEPPKLPTPDELRDMLARLESRHDCNYGITWDHLDNLISDWEDDHA